MSGTDTMVLAMWGKDAASPVHALHFGFGMGAVLAPQLARPFIAERNFDDQKAVTGSSNSSITPTGTPFEVSSYPEQKPTKLPGIESTIEIPYAISAVYSFIFCLLFLGFYIKGHKRRKAYKYRKSNIRAQEADASAFSSMKNDVTSFSPGSCTGGKTTYGFMFLLKFSCIMET